MQQRAKIAFELQTYWAGLTGNLPEREKANYNAREVEASVNEGVPAGEAAKKFLASRGVNIPIESSEKKTTVFILDIEGTTTPLPFVSQVMSPIILADLNDFVVEHYPADAAIVDAVQQAASRSPELQTALDADVASHHAEPHHTSVVRHLFVDHLMDAMKANDKQHYVKLIQGEVWAAACARTGLTTHVFKDAATFVKQMGRPNQTNTRVAIYSSGSALAQQVIMRHTEHGDLTPFISAFIDPSMVGGKLMPSSYTKIATRLSTELSAECGDDMRFIFITDNPTEASSAEASGAIACSVLCFRPLNAWVTFDALVALGLPGIASLSQLTSPSGPVDFEEQVTSVLNLTKKYDGFLF